MLEPHADRLVDYLRAWQGAFVDFRRAAQMVVLDVTTEMLTGESKLSLASSISASTKGKESGDSTKGAALLDLIDELELYGNTASELGLFALPIFAVCYRKITALITGIRRFFEIATHDVQLAIQRRCGSSAGSGESTIIEQLHGSRSNTTPSPRRAPEHFLRRHRHHHRLSCQSLRLPRTAPSHRQADPNQDCPGRGRSDARRGRPRPLTIPARRHLRDPPPIQPRSVPTRRVRADTVLPRSGGHNGTSRIFIRRGTCIIWSTYTANRQAGIYRDDPADFRPERRLEEEGPVRGQSRGAFIPFGSGRRNCLGQQFIILQTLYIAAWLLTAFEHFQLSDRDIPF
jgi:hypothetical protein